MGIVESNGFLFHDGLISDFIVVEDSRIDEYVGYINQYQIKSVSLNTLHYNRNEIDFLARCADVEKIMITHDNIKDLSVFYNLTNLRHLVLGGVAGELDMSRLYRLEEAHLAWSQHVKGLEHCEALRRIGLSKYNPKSKNLAELSNLHSLEEITITQSTITSLKGCGDIPLLSKIELNYMSKFETIDEIEKNEHTLKTLRFDSCKKIKNHEYVSGLKALEWLAFDSCSDIPSIGFIRELPKLKRFTFVDTNIVDGDLSPCVGLEHVGFANKRHYSHTSEDFKRK